MNKNISIRSHFSREELLQQDLMDLKIAASGYANTEIREFRAHLRTRLVKVVDGCLHALRTEVQNRGHLCSILLSIYSIPNPARPSTLFRYKSDIVFRTLLSEAGIDMSKDKSSRMRVSQDKRVTKMLLYVVNPIEYIAIPHPNNCEQEILCPTNRLAYASPDKGSHLVDTVFALMCHCRRSIRLDFDPIATNIFSQTKTEDIPHIQNKLTQSYRLLVANSPVLNIEIAIRLWFPISKGIKQHVTHSGLRPLRRAGMIQKDRERIRKLLNGPTYMKNLAQLWRILSTNPLFKSEFYPQTQRLLVRAASPFQPTKLFNAEKNRLCVQHRLHSPDAWLSRCSSIEKTIQGVDKQFSLSRVLQYLMPSLPTPHLLRFRASRFCRHR